jgi:hypothetical protein
MAERRTYDDDRGGRSRDSERSSTRRGDDRDDDRRTSSRDSRDDDRGSRRESSRDSDRDSRGRDDGRRSSRDDDDRGSRRSGRSSFEYKARDEEDTKRRATQGANDFDKILNDKVKMFKPQDGDNRVRILPPTWPDAKHFGLDIFVNYGVGPDRQSYLDLYKMKGEDDPVHDLLVKTKEEIGSTDNKEDLQYIKDLTAKKRVLVYLVDRNDPKAGVQAWAMPWTIDRDITKVSVDKENGAVLQIDHPEDGYDVEFEKSGKGARTEYLAVQIARRSTPLGDDRWLEYAQDNPLPDQLNYFDYDHIAKALGGGGSHKSKSDRDRDDDRGSSRDRGRDGDRGRGDDRDDRGRDRGRDDDRGGRDDPPARGGRDRDDDRRKDEGPTWASVHEMRHRELEDLIDQERLKIKASEAKDDEDLADWICDELGLKKPAERRRDADKDDDSTDSKLRDMRRRRED